MNSLILSLSYTPARWCHPGDSALYAEMLRGPFSLFTMKLGPGTAAHSPPLCP